MVNDIKCPKCGNVFDVENVIAADLEQKYQQQYQEKLNQSLIQMEEGKKKLQVEVQNFEEKKKKENELFTQKLQQEKIKLQTEIQEQLQKTISSDYENKLRLMEDTNKNNEEKLKEARKKELEFLQKEQSLKDKEAELEITLQKKLQEEREIISEQIRNQENEKNAFKETSSQLKIKELELQLSEQKKLADEMKRRAEQGSMQRQGEAQEILLEEILMTAFPHDTIGEVPKGKKGADCLLTVKNKLGQDCGKILFESKRTNKWSAEWIEKLKQDAVNCNADIAVLISQALPDKMEEKFEIRENVWICGFNDVKDIKLLTATLREGIIRLYTATKSQQGKGDKMQDLYDYLTSQEFASQWRNIREVFKNMQISIQKERDAMERLWKNREKQLDRALLNSSHIMGNIEGIAGLNMIDFDLSDENDNLLEE